MSAVNTPELFWEPNEIDGYTANGDEGRQYITMPSSNDPGFPVILLTSGVTEPFKYRSLHAAQKAAQATEDLIVLGDQALMDGHQMLADHVRDHLAGAPSEGTP